MYKSDSSQHRRAYFSSCTTRWHRRESSLLRWRWCRGALKRDSFHNIADFSSYVCVYCGALFLSQSPAEFQIVRAMSYTVHFFSNTKLRFWNDKSVLEKVLNYKVVVYTWHCATLHIFLLVCAFMAKSNKCSSHSVCLSVCSEKHVRFETYLLTKIKSSCRNERSEWDIDLVINRYSRKWLHPVI